VIQLARDSKAFGLSAWGLRDANTTDDALGDDGKGEVVVSIVGRGVGNVGRKIA
jgi:RNA 3'-terminal phosphate cyclase-like protein